MQSRAGQLQVSLTHASLSVWDTGTWPLLVWRILSRRLVGKRQCKEGPQCKVLEHRLGHTRSSPSEGTEGPHREEGRDRSTGLPSGCWAKRGATQSRQRAGGTCCKRKRSFLMRRMYLLPFPPQGVGRGEVRLNITPR